MCVKAGPGSGGIEVQLKASTSALKACMYMLQKDRKYKKKVTCSFFSTE